LPQPYLRKAVLAGLGRADVSETLPPQALASLKLVSPSMLNLHSALQVLHHPGPGAALHELSCMYAEPGAPRQCVHADTIVLPYNVVPTLPADVGLVCVEPVAANMGLVPPTPEFLIGLRAECDRVGALLLFDEVITGFRLGVGGATEWSGVQPDVWCFGKVIGGGLPVGCFGGSAEVMAHLAPLGAVYQAGTLSGNPLATAAGLAVLSELDAGAYEQLVANATVLAEGLRSAADAARVPAVVPQVGPLVGLFFGDSAPTDFSSARASVSTLKLVSRSANSGESMAWSMRNPRLVSNAAP
jgi:glutamate-1-semialdehyde 2,1-aminomutase